MGWSFCRFVCQCQECGHWQTHVWRYFATVTTSTIHVCADCAGGSTSDVNQNKES